MKRSQNDLKAGGFDTSLLLELAQDSSQYGRGELATRICGLFQNRLTEEEEKLATSILLSLIKQAEEDFKETLSMRLAPLEYIPREVILTLADDKISIAAYVLRESSLLKDKELIYMIKERAVEYTREIAKRESLTPIVLTSLVDKSDEITIGTLIGNKDLVIPHEIVKKIAHFTMRAQSLQEPLLLRPEINSDIAAEIYVCLSQVLRVDLARRFKLDKNIINKAVDDTLDSFMQSSRARIEVSKEVMTMAIYASEENQINAKALITALRRSQYSYFIALLATWMQISSGSVIPLLERNNAQGLVAFCRAKNIQKPEFASIFLLSRGLRTGNKEVNKTELSTALLSFERMKQSEAQKHLNMWRKNPSLI